MCATFSPKALPIIINVELLLSQILTSVSGWEQLADVFILKISGSQLCVVSACLRDPKIMMKLSRLLSDIINNDITEETNLESPAGWKYLLVNWSVSVTSIVDHWRRIDELLREFLISSLVNPKESARHADCNLFRVSMYTSVTWRHKHTVLSHRMTVSTITSRVFNRKSLSVALGNRYSSRC